MIIEKIPAGIYAVNCYVVACEDTKKACVIDPGGDADEILNYIEKNQLDLLYIILTHAHGDHIGGIPKIKEKKNVPIFIHKEDEEMLKDGNKNLSSLMNGPTVEITPDKLLSDGDVIELGNLKLNIIHTPGHTRGGICIKVDNILFTGDTLFFNSIGRTDFEGGSFEQIIDSIRRKLFILDDKTKVLPGHGPYSTIGIEKTSNPFINN
ncbi:MBL fold metallo-hydrolase [Crassaminicella indica]|uniref:MBL fold metallo-hydrolase n=1 Tax=Crassaminicella indica TaxID=2855394 RepID=A0ABX8RA57_9CLOT|nr:MBL fold metallo-hydrolase [Crassaminicella indica]QXM05940.1 MBL fold metallo-hydrolase [Crassaminicella indica]